MDLVVGGWRRGGIELEKSGRVPCFEKYRVHLGSELGSWIRGSWAGGVGLSLL